MTNLDILLLAISLAMDAFAVSVANGAVLKGSHLYHGLRFGTAFGIFQAFMPLLGYALGITLSGFIANIDHFIAFGLLTFIGINTIREARKGEEVGGTVTLGKLIIFAIATSIDALAVGVTFAFFNVNLAFACTVIGVVAFIFSFAGIILGKRLGSFAGKYSAYLGGTVLILLGIKILAEHWIIPMFM